MEAIELEPISTDFQSATLTISATLHGQEGTTDEISKQLLEDIEVLANLKTYLNI